MSTEARSWAKTHSFGGASKKGAGTRKDILRFLADEAGHDGAVVDAGIDWIEHETEISSKTIKRVLHEFQEMNLLHREQQPHAAFEGQMTDVIVLHLWNTGDKLPWKTLKQLKREKARSRARWGAPYETPQEAYYGASAAASKPVDNSQNQGYPQVDMMSSDSYHVEKSQKSDLAPVESGHHVQTSGHHVQASGHHVQQNTPKMDMMSKTQKMPLIGSRVQTSPIDIPISQSVSQSSGPVDNFSARTDRPTAAPEENSPIVHGVKLSALRSMLEAKSGSSLASISDAELGRMVTIVVSRATAPVRSPLAFAITAIGSELQELHSLAVSLLAAEAAQKAPKGFCSTHTREFTGSCPLCAKEASGALCLEPTSAPESQGLDRAAGVAFREKIRARRLAQNA